MSFKFQVVTVWIFSAQASPSSSSQIHEVKDIANAVNKRLGMQEKDQFLKDHWKPPLNYEFPSQRDGMQNRNFQVGWLGTFKWLAYSPSQKGSFCKFCVIFPQLQAGGQVIYNNLTYLS